MLVASLYGSNTAPTSVTNGTRLGQTTIVNSNPAFTTGTIGPVYGGKPVTIVSSNVVGVLDCPECGGKTRTIVNTLAPTYWVRESAAEVSERLNAALKEGCATK